MKFKKIITILLLTFASSAFAQQLYKIEYTYTDMDNYACNSILFTDNKEAVFKIYDSRESGLTKISDEHSILVENDPLSKFFYSDGENVYHRFITENREIVYKDEYVKKINWEIKTDSKKVIKGYNCTEAHLRLNGRSYTAWFTFDVPVKFGPLKLHQLPGLIVEVAEDGAYLKLALKNVSKTIDNSEFKACKKFFLEKKKVMDYVEYERKVTDIDVTLRKRLLAAIKETNTNGVILSDDVRWSYLDTPSSLASELKKLH